MRGEIARRSRRRRRPGGARRDRGEIEARSRRELGLARVGQLVEKVRGAVVAVGGDEHLLDEGRGGREELVAHARLDRRRLQPRSGELASGREGEVRRDAARSAASTSARRAASSSCTSSSGISSSCRRAASLACSKPCAATAAGAGEGEGGQGGGGGVYRVAEERHGGRRRGGGRRGAASPRGAAGEIAGDRACWACRAAHAMGSASSGSEREGRGTRA